MLGQRFGVGVGAELVEQPRRALDVGEEERDRAGREVGAHGSARAPGGRQQRPGRRDADGVPPEVGTRELAHGRERRAARVDSRQAARRSAAPARASRRPRSRRVSAKRAAPRSGRRRPTRSACRCRGSCRGCRRSRARGTTRSRGGRAGRGRRRDRRRPGRPRARTRRRCRAARRGTSPAPAARAAGPFPSAPACIVTTTTSAFRSAFRTSFTASSMSSRLCAQGYGAKPTNATFVPPFRSDGDLARPAREAKAGALERGDRLGLARSLRSRERGCWRGS